MRFRLSNGRDWAGEFDAVAPIALAAGIQRVRATRLRTQGAGGHPIIALRRRLAEVDRWLREREARCGGTTDQLGSWRGIASVRRHDARRAAGIVESLALHVRTPGGDWAHTGRGVLPLSVPWTLSAADLRAGAQQWFADAADNLAHIARISGLASFVSADMLAPPRLACAP